MPIYEYRCRDCGKVHEALVRVIGGSSPGCPACGSHDLERLYSSSYVVRAGPTNPGTTCCGREERCEAPPCSTGNVCRRR